MITVVIGKIIHGALYLGGPTIQEVDGEMMMGLSIYGFVGRYTPDSTVFKYEYYGDRSREF